MVRFCFLILITVGVFYLLQQPPSGKQLLGLGLASLTFSIAAVVRVPIRAAPKRQSGFFIR
jgi:hypothetical protein